MLSRVFARALCLAVPLVGCKHQKEQRHPCAVRQKNQIKADSCCLSSATVLIAFTRWVLSRTDSWMLEIVQKSFRLALDKQLYKLFRNDILMSACWHAGCVFFFLQVSDVSVGVINSPRFSPAFLENFNFSWKSGFTIKKTKCMIYFSYIGHGHTYISMQKQGWEMKKTGSLFYNINTTKACLNKSLKCYC